jgi:hypothetical protein
MRYILQVLAMLGDLATFGICILLIYLMWSIGKNSLLVDFLIIAVLMRWYKNGSIEAWRPSVIRQFMKNAKKCSF